MTISRFILTPTLFLVLFSTGFSQTPCNTPGQNPTSAFPVCGTGTFIQSSVNLCGGRTLPHPVCSPSYDDRNPYYYKFTCFEAGTLGLLITPNAAASDYDWQIFDITGRSPNDIFTASGLTVSSNWSGNPGQTGTNGTAAGQHECGGNTPNFSRWPTLVKGHEYLLMISHFSNNQAGYKLEFKGGTAIITDTAKPLMKEIKAGCSGTQFYLKLSKPVKCSSIATDGSDWEFVNSPVPVSAAAGANCIGGFDTDSILITSAGRLPAGTFAIRSKKGADGNTLLDFCDNELAQGQALVVNILPPTPTSPDSILKVGCKPTELELVMRDPILCNSIAADGSDFVITGPATVTIAGATQVNCLNGQVKTIRIQLRRPVTLGGTYTVSIKQGSDGNTLMNACNIASLQGESVSFTGYDSVLARIDVGVKSSCEADTLTFSNPGTNGINLWRWTEPGTNQTGNSPLYRRIYTTPGEVYMDLTVSNGICTDSGKAVVNLSNFRVKAAFEYPAFACPDDTIRFMDKSTGPVAAWKWNFGNGNTSNVQVPPNQFFTSSSLLSKVPVELVVSQANGCSDTISQIISVPNNCYIAIPNAFTPNGDGLNDFLYPLNAWRATDLLFRVYNRYGQLVWETTDWTRKWDGTRSGNKVPAGTYVWMLQYTESDTGKRVVQKGTTTLIR
jgi:gliding motility-associated-like protein